MTSAATQDAAAPRLVGVLVEVEPPHLDRPFHYDAGEPGPVPPVGARVEVVFAGRRRRAIVVDHPAGTDVDPSRLRSLSKVLGPHVWITPDELDVVAWAARRWCAPRGDVLRHAMPGRTIRLEQEFVAAGLLPWTPESALAAGNRPAPETPTPDVAVPAAWARYRDADRVFAHAGDGAGLVWRPLADEDIATRLAEAVLATVDRGRDALVVVPDAGSRIAAALAAQLRPALRTRGLDRAALVDVVGRSTAASVQRGWLRARTGQARVVIGERRVVFWPLARPGLFVCLDEANPGHKERRSPRHHTREVVLERARRARARAVLTTTVPSAPTWALLQAGRVSGVVPDRGDEVRAGPQVVVDSATNTRLGREGLGAVRRALGQSHHAVVLAARRGEGRAMVCQTCGQRPTCDDCGASLAGDQRRLACPVCGWTTPRRCRHCGGARFVPLAAGTGRLATELRQALPDRQVVVVEGYDGEVPDVPSVLVMTRGSVLDLPPGPVGAVVVGDADGLVLRPSVDAPEDTLRLVFTAGTWLARSRFEVDAPPWRDVRPPQLVVVTAHEHDDWAVALRRWDPASYWRSAAATRAPFPPVRTAIAVRAAERVAIEELCATASPDDLVLGPVRDDPDVGQEQWRALLLTPDRATLVTALWHARVGLSRRNLTTAVDVEPMALA